MAARLLTDADNIIRDLDIPERMQLASAGLPTLELIDDLPAPFISELDLPEAAQWMSQKISPRCTEEFIMKDEYGNRPPLYDEFLESVRSAIKFMNVDFLEVPFIYHHRSDFLVHYNPEAIDLHDKNIAFLNQDDLFKISSLSIKYRSLNYRKEELKTLFEEITELEHDLGNPDFEDEYFEELITGSESVEEIADVQEWVSMKYGKQLIDLKDKKEREAAVEGDGSRKIKRATRESFYLNAKKSIITKLAEVCLFKFSYSFLYLSCY